MQEANEAQDDQAHHIHPHPVGNQQRHRQNQYSDNLESCRDRSLPNRLILPIMPQRARSGRKNSVENSSKRLAIPLAIAMAGVTSAHAMMVRGAMGRVRNRRKPQDTHNPTPLSRVLHSAGIGTTGFSSGAPASPGSDPIDIPICATIERGSGNRQHVGTGRGGSKWAAW